jgi:hypothetical protein
MDAAVQEYFCPHEHRKVVVSILFFIGFSRVETARL